MAVGDTITAARYNIIQARIAAVIGVGSGDEGYGQARASPNSCGRSNNNSPKTWLICLLI